MKKILIIVLMLLFSFTAMSCNSMREYKIEDPLLLANQPDDLYRVYYEIFVGSFSDSNDDGIGDIRGMINRFDYLNDGDSNSGKSLGIEGLWLMPIMPSPSYHKYDVTNYKEIDSKYGTLEEFEEFLDLAEERNVYVIIDLVLNHTSNQHPWFKAAKQAMEASDLDSKYLDYYVLVTKEEKEPGKIYYPFTGEYYYEGNFSSSMPELNLDSVDVRAEIVDIVSFWYDLGVDGFRLDAAKYPYLNEDDKNIDFWNWFVTECKNINPDTYIIGEVWSGDSLIAPYYESFSNFDFGMSQLQGAVSLVAQGLDDVNWYVSYLNNYRNLVENYNPEAILTPFISNHDMNRSAGYLSLDDYEMQMAANLYILTYGNPFIYYGEEIGMKGSRTTEMTDANKRLAMLWGDKDTVEDPIGTTYNEENQTNGTVKSQLKDSESLLNHYKKLIMIRKSNPEIARGTYTPIIFNGYYSFGGFLSTYENSTVGVFHNLSDEELVIDLSNYTNHEFETIRAYVGVNSASLSGQTLTIGAYTSVILK
ncbi:MAG: alpha-amylase family glycosyl hydrolase [Candidatus Izemoplasmatales bacterium]|nr:alpha-amylase family glycosyl hydrolase [Candidatus Izemoplasmatales bacterium]